MNAVHGLLPEHCNWRAMALVRKMNYRVVGGYREKRVTATDTYSHSIHWLAKDKYEQAQTPSSEPLKLVNTVTVRVFIWQQSRALMRAPPPIHSRSSRTQPTLSPANRAFPRRRNG